MREQDSMLEKTKNALMSGIKMFFNKSPIWNEVTQGYYLNFNERVTFSSVKNFQLIDGSNEDIIYL